MTCQVTCVVSGTNERERETHLCKRRGTHSSETNEKITSTRNTKQRVTGRGGNPVNNMGVNSSSRQDASFLSDEDGKYGNRARAQGCFTRAGSDDGEWGHSLTNGSCWFPFPCSVFFLLLLCLCCKVAAGEMQTKTRYMLTPAEPVQ